jgi:hypothetical protein
VSRVIGQFVAKTSAKAIIPQFLLTGAGEGFGDKADSFFFLWQPASNSVPFSARLLKLENGSLESMCGIMIRESDEVDAPFAFIGASSAMVFSVHRDTKGATCARKEVPKKDQSISFRIAQGTNGFITEYSLNGTNWTILVPSKPMMRNENYLEGFAVFSGSTNRTVTAHFDNVTTNSLARGSP